LNLAILVKECSSNANLIDYIISSQNDCKLHLIIYWLFT